MSSDMRSVPDLKIEK